MVLFIIVSYGIVYYEVYSLSLFSLYLYLYFHLFSSPFPYFLHSFTPHNYVRYSLSYYLIHIIQFLFFLFIFHLSFIPCAFIYSFIYLFFQSFIYQLIYLYISLPGKDDCHFIAEKCLPPDVRKKLVGKYTL